MGVRISKSYYIEQLSQLKQESCELIQSFYEEGVTGPSISRALSISQNILDYMKNDDFLDSVKIFKDYKPYAMAHPFLVSLISVMICRRLEWSTERTLKIIAVGGLLHNVGMIKMPDNVKCNPPEDLSETDLEIYKTHPEIGMKILQDFPELPSAVLQIALQHHESNGKGFPNALSANKIFPLARIVFLAENFVRFNFEKDTILQDGLKAFLADKKEIAHYESDLMRAFIKSFIKEEKIK